MTTRREPPDQRPPGHGPTNHDLPGRDLPGHGLPEDDSPDDDEERAFDAFLRGKDALAAGLRGLEQPTPPPQLDARIRAQAQAALRAAAGAANDAKDADDANAANDAEERALVASPLGRWRGPLALAATVVIGVSLGLQWDGWRARAPQSLSDAMPAAAPAPAATPEPGPGPGPDLVPESGPVRASEVAPASAAPAPAAPLATAPVAAPPPRRHGDAGAVRAAPAPTAARDPAPAAPPPPAPPAPSPAPMAAPALVDLRAAPKTSGDDALQSSLLEAPPPAAPVLAYVTRPEGGTRVEVTGSRIGRATPPAPRARAAPRDAAAERRARQGLQLIGELLDLHLDDEARATWRCFREDYPDYPVPDGLRRRVEALAPATGRSRESGNPY
jgi:hypothetical protein